MTPKLRFDQSKIIEIASRYEYSNSEDDLLNLRPKIRKRGYLKSEELMKISYWKAPRSSMHVLGNSSNYIEEITAFAFSAQEERSRIEILTLLTGVSWPSASVILHFYHTDPYPIIDFRALWSANLNIPGTYNFMKWWNYVVFCRLIAKEEHVDMRTLDRALWQYSKENQKTNQ